VGIGCQPSRLVRVSYRADGVAAAVSLSSRRLELETRVDALIAIVACPPRAPACRALAVGAAEAPRLDAAARLAALAERAEIVRKLLVASGACQAAGDPCAGPAQAAAEAALVGLETALVGLP
jgi:hypothetical protein